MTVAPRRLLRMPEVLLIRHHKGWQGWSAEVEVDGVRYQVGVTRGKSVRLAYRGKQRGWQWHGYVRRDGAGEHLLACRVPGSLGIHGLLLDAGVLDLAREIRALRLIGGAS